MQIAKQVADSSLDRCNPPAQVFQGAGLLVVVEDPELAR